MTFARLDIDGTLVDTNYHHYDRLVPGADRRAGRGRSGGEIRANEKALYVQLLDEAETMEGSRELIEDLKRCGHTVIFAIADQGQNGTFTARDSLTVMLCQPGSSYGLTVVRGGRRLNTYYGELPPAVTVERKLRLRLACRFRCSTGWPKASAFVRRRTRIPSTGGPCSVVCSEWDCALARTSPVAWASTFGARRRWR